MLIQGTQAGACIEALFLFGARWVLFHFKYISQRTRGKARPSRPLLSTTPQCRRNGAQFVISALMWEGRRRDASRIIADRRHLFFSADSKSILLFQAGRTMNRLYIPANRVHRLCPYPESDVFYRASLSDNKERLIH